jgi:hypothetical protein
VCWYLLEHLVALGSHVIAEFDEEFDHVQRGWWVYPQTPRDVSAMLKQTSHQWQVVGRCGVAANGRVVCVQWSCGKQFTHTCNVVRLARLFELELVCANRRAGLGEGLWKAVGTSLATE